MREQEFADRVAELVREMVGAEEAVGTFFDAGHQIGVAVKWADYPKRHAKREFLGLSPSLHEAEAVARLLADYFNGWHARMLANG